MSSFFAHKCTVIYPLLSITIDLGKRSIRIRVRKHMDSTIACMLHRDSEPRYGRVNYTELRTRRPNPLHGNRLGEWKSMLFRDIPWAFTSLSDEILWLTLFGPRQRGKRQKNSADISPNVDRMYLKLIILNTKLITLNLYRTIVNNVLL